MKSKLFLIVLTTLLMTTAFAEPQAANGTISNVIVYHGRALVTRTIELDKTDGDIELLVNNLPDHILPESLYAQAEDGIGVLSVRYRSREIKQDTREEVQELDQQFEMLEDQLHKAKRDRQYMTAISNKFSKMWDLSFQAADVSLDQAAFSSESMKDFTSYLEEKYQGIHNRAVELELQAKDLEKQLAEVTRQKEELARQHQHVIREALVYLHIPKAAKSHTVQLSYLVTGADWSPQYNLKADPDGKEVRIEYNAVVHQSSGEDWNNAALSLSTAVPALVAGAPELEPMKVDLITGHQKYNLGRGLPVSSNGNIQVAAEAPQQDIYAYQDQTQMFDELIQSRRTNIGKGIQAQQMLNSIAIGNQMIEFEADKRMLKELNRKAVAIRRAEGVSVLYRLDGKLTLPSKSDQQLVTIAAFDSKAEFVFTAAPLLTDYVYLQAEIVNNSDTILLPGSADMFRNGQFVGKGDMTLVTIGQTFTAGFGVDSQIQVTREFKDKKIESFLGNRIDEHYYRIAVENYYDKPIALRLIDRLPWTESKELGIELNSTSHALSTDAEYVRTEKDRGILRWDLQLKPNTTGQKATIVNYAFTLKYDNDMAIRTIR